MTCCLRGRLWLWLWLWLLKLRSGHDTCRLACCRRLRNSCRSHVLGRRQTCLRRETCSLWCRLLLWLRLLQLRGGHVRCRSHVRGGHTGNRMGSKHRTWWLRLWGWSILCRRLGHGSSSGSGRVPRLRVVGERLGRSWGLGSGGWWLEHGAGLRVWHPSHAGLLVLRTKRHLWWRLGIDGGHLRLLPPLRRRTALERQVWWRWCISSSMVWGKATGL